MAVHVIYLKLEGYIRMWLIRNFSDGKEPVIFPKWSLENDILQDNLQRRPKDWQPVREEGTIAIKVPKREGFNRNTWCYVSKQTLVILYCALYHRVIHKGCHKVGANVCAKLFIVAPVQKAHNRNNHNLVAHKGKNL